ncbi:MAG: diadenylate cyclase CdaA [Bacteroidales bacterium]|nr:diadenylate cyclase CdaA [Bacteroidales bacterium]
MLLEIPIYLRMSFVDVLDILAVAAIIYFIFKWSRGTSAMNILIAIIIIFLFRYLSTALGLKMISSLLGVVLDVGAVALVVIFQPEIRRFLNKMGSKGLGGRKLIMNKILGRSEVKMSHPDVDEITKACREMGEQMTGALIVIRHSDAMEDIVETGDIIDAKISKRLIMNIFFKNSPLHDGAMIIDRDRILAARCTLPVTDRQDIPASFGMRHKAAIGLSERNDADVIVVSEQTGHITFVREGKAEPITNINTLKLLLTNEDDKRKAGDEAGVRQDQK